MKLYILRHAETHYNAARILQGHKNSLLNIEGQAQAKRVGEYLKNVPFDAVFGSDLIRCQETAELVLDQNVTNSEPIVQFSPNFRERAMGELEGMSVDDAQRFCMAQGKSFQDYGEKSQNALIRMIQGFQTTIKVMSAKGMENALLVSHGSVIPKLLRSLLQQNILDCGQFGENSIKVPHNTAITVLENNGNGWSLKAINDTTHLGNTTAIDPLVL